MDSFSIVEKLKFGEKIGKDELNYLRKQVISPDENEDLDSSIRAFGLAFTPSKENIKLIEGYLESSDDIIRSAAIKTLCEKSYWGLAKDYLNYLLSIIERKNLDLFSDSQDVAFGVLGEYLSEYDDANTFTTIYSMFERELADLLEDSDQYVLKNRLENIYFALDYGIRGRQALIERRVGRMSFPEDVNDQVINKVKAKVKKASK